MLRIEHLTMARFGGWGLAGKSVSSDQSPRTAFAMMLRWISFEPA